jgi:hypothetical protein
MYNDLTYLYQALAKARATVQELERAIEAKAFNEPARWTGAKGYNSDTNGNRESFYNWVEEKENTENNHDR